MWKTIDSAPKDGTRILVKNGNILNATPHVAAFTYYDSCFRDVWDTNLKLDNITHWHPIPTDNNAENVELEWWEWETKLNNVAPSHPIPVDNNTENIDLLNWINLINNAVCLLPDVKNETVQVLIEARNKVIK